MNPFGTDGVEDCEQVIDVVGDLQRMARLVGTTACGLDDAQFSGDAMAAQSQGIAETAQPFCRISSRSFACSAG